MTSLTYCMTSQMVSEASLMAAASSSVTQRLDNCYKPHTHTPAQQLSFHVNLGLTDSPSPHILFNTIPPCPSQTREGMAVKEEEWRESTFHEGWLVQRFWGQMPLLSSTTWVTTYQCCMTTASATVKYVTPGIQTNALSIAASIAAIFKGIKLTRHCSLRC